MNNSKIFFSIDFEVENYDLYEPAKKFGLEHPCEVKIGYMDNSIISFDNFRQFLETEEEVENINDIDFVISRNEYELSDEYIFIRLRANGGNAQYIIGSVNSMKIVSEFLGLSDIKSAIIHHQIDISAHTSPSEKGLLSYLGYIPDYVQLYQDFDYSLSKTLKVVEESMPGHGHNCEGLDFKPSWQMYFSESYYKVIPKPLWDDFQDCEENIIMESGLRKITLYEDILSYDSAESRSRQWAFRRLLGIDSICHELERKPKPISENLPVIVTRKGCEVGFTKVIRYLNKENQLVSSNDASKMEIKEYLGDGITIVLERTENL